jgi:hypothetical protein
MISTVPIDISAVFRPQNYLFSRNPSANRHYCPKIVFIPLDHIFVYSRKSPLTAPNPHLFPQDAPSFIAQNRLFLRPAARRGAAANFAIGEVAERSIVAVSKTVVRATVPRVRIPPSPLIVYQIYLESLLNVVLTGFLLDGGG